jgi:hypothetical protein
VKLRIRSLLKGEELDGERGSGSIAKAGKSRQRRSIQRDRSVDVQPVSRAKREDCRTHLEWQLIRQDATYQVGDVP